MKNVISVVLLFLVTAFGYYLLHSGSEVEKVTESDIETIVAEDEGKVFPEIIPISHASFILEWEDLVIYNDPVGDASLYANQKPADLVLVSDIHGDHLNVDTLKAVIGPNTSLVAPQAVIDELPADLANRAMLTINGQLIRNDVQGIAITAVPMYNTPEQGIEIRHEKGQGNGYLIEKGGARIYIAGDTAVTDEMKALTDIDIAFIPMNLPYTMSVEDAAAGVTAFKPAKVYPYHFRTPEGFSDTSLFKQLVNEQAPEVEVVQLDWYAN